MSVVGIVPCGLSEIESKLFKFCPTLLSCPRLMNGAIELYKLELVRVIQANDRIKLRINYKELHHPCIWTTRDMQSTCTQLFDFLVIVSNRIHRVINGTTTDSSYEPCVLQSACRDCMVANYHMHQCPLLK